MYKIYNENVKDLLNPSDKHLAIREHPQNGIFVQDLAELIVTTSEEVENYINEGNLVSLLHLNSNLYLDLKIKEYQI